MDQQTKDDTQKKCEYGAFALVRFESNLFGNFRNSVCKNMSIVSNCKGTILGASPTVYIEESGVGFWDGRHGIAVFDFPSVEDAKLWFMGMPDLKQHDFLFGSTDVIIVRKRTATPTDKSTIAILDAHIKDENTFFDKFASKESLKLRERDDVAVAVAVDTKVIKMKGCWDPDYTVLHFFKNYEAFKEYRQSSENAQLLRDRQASAESDEVVFNLSPL